MAVSIGGVEAVLVGSGGTDDELATDGALDFTAAIADEGGRLVADDVAVGSLEASMVALGAPGGLMLATSTTDASPMAVADALAMGFCGAAGDDGAVGSESLGPEPSET